MASVMEPYADDEAGMTVGGLTIENGTDQISLSGSLYFAKDKQALDNARALHELFGNIVAALEAEKDLPARSASPKPAATTRKANPFA